MYAYLNWREMKVANVSISSVTAHIKRTLMFKRAKLVHYPYTYMLQVVLL